MTNDLISINVILSKCLLGAIIIFIIVVMMKLMLSPNPRQVKKQVIDEFSKKDRWRKVYDNLIGKIKNG